ncbi:hypothetical protein AXF42_Ash008778 [Apostasia shenzhenica]|uniref:FAS1 domain-containing protein n=1 Tax=Apostasia shenzhenica TaxID=1088818 RepID=A0A2I0ASG3_9ASPA|nr:hypothetical protein AXF42_Ash008778 [Apostasia shenzhenica]
MGFWRKWRRGFCIRRLSALLFIFAPLFCIQFFFGPGLPDLTRNSRGRIRIRTSENGTRITQIGDFGSLLISMLPDDLAFTVFVPSEAAFEHVLKLTAKTSLMNDKMNATHAILSRAMAFCAVSQRVDSAAVPLLKELLLESVSGFRISVSRASNGALVANNVKSELVDIRKGEIIVHIMDGVIMDAEFEQSFLPDN